MPITLEWKPVVEEIRTKRLRHKRGWEGYQVGGRLFQAVACS